MKNIINSLLVLNVAAGCIGAWTSNSDHLFFVASFFMMASAFVFVLINRK